MEVSNHSQEVTVTPVALAFAGKTSNTFAALNLGQKPIVMGRRPLTRWAGLFAGVEPIS